MGFWDEYKELDGAYIKAAEKKVLTENGIPMIVEAVVEGSYEGEPRYECQVRVPNPETGDEETRRIAFAKGSGAESRDRMLANLMGYLEREDAEEVTVKLEKAGRAYLLRQA